MTFPFKHWEGRQGKSTSLRVQNRFMRALARVAKKPTFHLRLNSTCVFSCVSQNSKYKQKQNNRKTEK